MRPESESSKVDEYYKNWHITWAGNSSGINIFTATNDGCEKIGATDVPVLKKMIDFLAIEDDKKFR
jgi:hypothetical protein